MEISTQEAALGDRSPAILRRKGRKRVLTENRKQQNREAQRRFRDRKRALRTQASSAPDHDVGLSSVSSYVHDLDPLVGSPYEHSSTARNESFDALFDSMLVTQDDDITHNLHRGSDQHRTFAGAQANTSLHTTFTALPSPYLNFLQVQKLNFYAACIQNALYIGLPLKLAKGEGVISPWYWDTQFTAMLESSSSTLHSTTWSPMILTIARPIRPQKCFEISTSIMPDLMPTPLQRSSPHELYIDMIPFPVFRDRIITLLSMKPPAFDESELKRDIEADGLLVWGTGHAAGMDRSTAALVRDRRNWECARWFADKWKLLVSGSGLEEQSRWWRRMRGEDEDDADDT